MAGRTEKRSTCQKSTGAPRDGAHGSARRGRRLLDAWAKQAADLPRCLVLSLGSLCHLHPSLRIAPRPCAFLWFLTALPPPQFEPQIRLAVESTTVAAAAAGSYLDELRLEIGELVDGLPCVGR